MVESEPRSFVIAEQDDAFIRLTDVAMHRAFETDKSGTTAIHVWMVAEAAPATDDFESIEGSVEFVLYNDDNRLGSCTGRHLKFSDPEDRLDIKADDGLRIPSHEDVTRVEATVDAFKLTRAKTQLKLTPA